MAPRGPKTPKPPDVPGAGTITKARKCTNKDDFFSILKIMASRPEYYSEAAPYIAEAFESLNLKEFSLDDDEMILASEGIRSIKEFGYVHPKIGVTLRLFDKEAKEKNSEENINDIPEAEI